MSPIPDYASALLQRQIVLLYRNVVLAQSISVINAILLTVVNIGATGAVAALAWVAVAVTVAAGRVYLGKRFQHDGQRYPARFWLRAALLGAGLAGLVWAAGAFLFMRAAPEALQFFTAFVMAGMIAGAVPILSAQRNVFRAYAWPMGISVALISFSAGGLLNIAFAIMVVLFMIGVSRSADYFQATLVEALHLEMEKALLAEDLLHAKSAAEQASQAKSNFLAVVSHELRTPLNGIIGMADVLAMTKLNPEQSEFLDLLKQSGHDLQAIVGDILDMTQIEAGRMVIERQPFAVSDVVQMVTGRVSSRAAAKGLRFSCVLADDVPPLVLGDERALLRILDKLIENALKFTDQGYIDLSIRRCSDNDAPLQLEFSVSDSGIGIAADKLETIFEPFGQADSSITRRFGGTGLGLPISRRLAELLDGRLSVSSEPGVGSTFRLVLPLPLA